MDFRVVGLACVLALAELAAGCKAPPVEPGNNNNVSTQKCGDGWIYIPEGSFVMGINPEDRPFSEGNQPDAESPKHPVWLSAYCIQKTEVSVSEYRKCVQAGACEVPDHDVTYLTPCNYTPEPGDPVDRERHPVNCLSWAKARAFCRWMGGDLPSEAQWEKAARGTDERWYPWGNEPPDCSRCNYDENGPFDMDSGEGDGWGCNHGVAPMTWEVGHLTSSKGDSPYGLKDMAGNVAEFVLDCSDPDFYAQCAESECRDPVNVLEVDCAHVSRGNGADTWADWALFGLTTYWRGVGGRSNELGYYNLGFRCARPPDES